MSEKLRHAFGLTEKPRVKTVEELELDYNTISSSMEKNKLKRTDLSKTINSQKKQMEKIQELMDNNNQLNMFPDE